MAKKHAVAEAESWDEPEPMEQAEPADAADGGDATGAAEGETLDTIRVMDRTYTVHLPYAEGHVLNHTEAAVLNQTYKENLRNNFVGAAKRALERGEAAPSQEAFDAYAAEYSFGARRGRGQVRLDPVAAEERKLCELCIKQALKDRQIKFSTVDKDKFESMVNTLQGTGKFRARAEEIVRQKQATKDLALDVSSLF